MQSHPSQKRAQARLAGAFHHIQLGHHLPHLHYARMPRRIRRILVFHLLDDLMVRRMEPLGKTLPPKTTAKRYTLHHGKRILRLRKLQQLPNHPHKPNWGGHCGVVFLPFQPQTYLHPVDRSPQPQGKEIPLDQVCHTRRRHAKNHHHFSVRKGLFLLPDVLRQ